jgi:hypothetical protein
MHFWRKKHFQTVKDVAADASTSPEWTDYAGFCSEYERGLRRQAFTTLERFVSSLARAPFVERRRFVSWLLQRADGRDGRHMLIPYPLHVRIVEPTLLEWTLVEPRCSEPDRWLGGYEHLKHAIELQPDDELARRKLLGLLLGKVGFSTHELPVGYLGKAREDLESPREAEELLRGLSSDEVRREFAEQIEEERRLIQEYFRKH